jgi:hypothetical protein
MSASVVQDLSSSRSSYLALTVLLAALFPRTLVALGAPGIIKFFHFALAILFCILTLPFTSRSSTKYLLFGLIALLWTIAVSALVNSAGLVNVVLDFVLLAEPFLLLIFIIDQPMSHRDMHCFHVVVALAVFAHTVLSYYQYLTLGIINPDDVKGLFLDQGAGHHVAGAVALTAAVYFFTVTRGSSPLVLRVILAASVASIAILSDSKQVILVFLIALSLRLLLKINDLKRFLQYTLLVVIAIGGGVLIAYTVLPGLAFWADIALIKKGIEAKLVIVSIVLSHYDSIFDWLFGLGPGHTVGRLASLLPDYLDQLRPLGATISNVTELTDQERMSNFVSNEKTGSSMWSPFFFWAGLWGDLGIVGCAAYLFLWHIVFRQVCTNELSHYFVFTILIFGMIFSWLEEPGYMLFVAALIGLGWQQRQHDAEDNGLEPSTLQVSARTQHA